MTKGLHDWLDLERPTSERPAGISKGHWDRLLDALRMNVTRPTRVAVMGQTGVGKSTLINALFGSSLATGDVRPTTTHPTEVNKELPDGRSLTFVDLPGMGESHLADATYLPMYASELANADILLWLFSAESRSLLTDIDCISRLAEQEPNRSLIAEKVTFALTKVDLAAQRWLLSHDGTWASFDPMPKEQAMLKAKADYVEETLNTALGFRTSDVAMTSTRFRYGLIEVLARVLESTDDATVSRLGAVLDLDSLTRMPVVDALEQRNFRVLDLRTNEFQEIAPTRKGKLL